jgi:uncharacterized protein with GYD domain
MSTYFMFGKYNTSEAVREITAVRTREAVGVIEKFNGQIVAMYALLGPYDLIFIVNLPGNAEAMQVSINLNRITGISFTTCPAITVNRMDAFVTPEPTEVAGPDTLDV